MLVAVTVVAMLVVGGVTFCSARRVVVVGSRRIWWRPHSAVEQVGWVCSTPATQCCGMQCLFYF